MYVHYIQKYLLNNNQNGIPDYSKLNQKAKQRHKRIFISYMAQAGRERGKRKEEKKRGCCKIQNFSISHPPPAPESPRPRAPSYIDSREKAIRFYLIICIISIIIIIIIIK